ncbi:MAG TPA: hypothetical protein VKR83_20145 [Ktedonobacteraceae bacterium]|nr:hypothetical protein [Ktedonobacteraceae bacterium]
MDKNVLRPQSSQQDSDANNGIEQKHAYFTLIQFMALILFLYGVLYKDAVSIWVGVALALAEERQSKIKKFLSLIKNFMNKNT